MAKKLLIVDDEEKILLALRTYLENIGYKVYCAQDGIIAMDLFEKYCPDMIILDLMMPNMSGEEVCRAIRLRSRVPIIMLTAKIEEQNILEGFGMGADDYVQKPFSLKQLGARIEAIFRRTTGEAIPLSNELVFDDGNLVIDSLRHEVRKQGQRIQLTPHEFKLLMTMAKYPSKVFTREELIQLVLGDDFEGFDRAIDSHVKNIRLKIEENSRTPKYLITVHGVGYKFGK